MIPVILSGGSGTRLWPVSRPSHPKQFADLFGEPLLAATCRRLAPLGQPWVVAVEDSRVLTERVLAQLGLPRERAIFEPVGRNTAPAVALVCHLLLAHGEGGEVVGVFPADHLISDQDELLAVCRLAEECARRGQVVTVGIRPSRPETGFGYVEAAAEVFAAAGGLEARRTLGFREKPDAATAAEFVARGNFFWNAGIFFFGAAAMSEHFRRLMPELWRRIATVTPDLANVAQVYRELPAESLDYGIMERLEGQVTIPCDPGWSDVGSWDEVARLGGVGAPAAGVVQSGGGGSFVHPFRDKVYALVGVSDLIVVDTADALLVTRKGASQQVREAVRELREAGRPAATRHAFEERPWGGFEVLRDGERFKSKILRVDPGQQLSYQSHTHRSEHWILVRGRPEVVLDGEVLRPRPGEALFIPRGARHRIRNPTDEVVELVEVQLGSYFGEDDIVRYEDDYGRVES